MLLGAITLSSNLRFVQTWYHWKEDISIFPTIPRMTYFEHYKASKSCPKKDGKKLSEISSRRDKIEEELSWWIRTGTSTQHDAVWILKCLSINKCSPLHHHTHTQFKGKGWNYRIFGRNSWERVFYSSFRSFWVRNQGFYLGNLSPSLSKLLSSIPSLHLYTLSYPFFITCMVEIMLEDPTMGNDSMWSTLYLLLHLFPFYYVGFVNGDDMWWSYNERWFTMIHGLIYFYSFHYKLSLFYKLSPCL